VIKDKKAIELLKQLKLGKITQAELV